MKKPVITVSAIAALLCVSAAAVAADLPGKEKVVAPLPYPEIYRTQSTQPYHWTSYFFGVQTGVVWAEDKGQSIFADSGFVIPSFDQFDQRNWLAGGQIGYNYQFANRIVAGLEADLAFTNLRESARTVYGTVGQDYEWMSTVRGRLGYAMDRILPYTTAGVAFAGTKGFANAPDGSSLGQDRETLVGWVAGAGLEYAMTDYLTLKGEYLHSRFGNAAYFMQPAGMDSGVWSKTSPSVDSIRFGMNYRFN